MKKYLTLFSTLSQLCFVQAQSFNSAFELKMFNNGTFIASMDNGPMSVPSKQVQFEEVIPGNHLLQVSRAVYNHRWHQYRYIPFFSAYVNVPSNTRMNALITPDQRFEIVNMVANYVAPVPVCSSHTVIYQDPRNVMTEVEFHRFLSAVHGASFEDNRLVMIQAQMKYNWFTAGQVASLVNEMWFESGRLEVAKMAYLRTVDRQNYYMVGEKFWFSNTINELNSYIASV